MALFRTFCVFWAPWRVFLHNFELFGQFFACFSPISIFLCFFWLLGGPRDPPRHQKTIKIVVLSSIFKVSLNWKKVASGITLGSFWGHFWLHFGSLWGPGGALGRHLGGPRAPKVGKRREKLRSKICFGTLRAQNGAQGAPGPPKWSPEAPKREPKS